MKAKMRLYAVKYLAEARIRSRLGLSADGRDPWVLLFPRHKIAYVPVPKAANSSIRAALLPLVGGDPGKDPRIQAFEGFEKHRFSQCYNWLDTDWFVFTVVRDPYARAASAFLDKVVHREPVLRAFRRMGMRKGDSFIHYLSTVSRWPRLSLNDHILPQSDLLCRPQPIPGFRVFKVEELDEAWPVISDEVKTRSGIELPKLARYNAGRYSASWTSIYDETSRQMVERIYSDDFQTFGYRYSPTLGMQTEI